MFAQKVFNMPPVINNTTDWLKQAFPVPIVITLVLYTMGASSFISSWKTDIEARLTLQEKLLNSLASHENRIVILEQAALRIREDLLEIKALLRERKASSDTMRTLDLKGTSDAVQ